MTSIEEFSIFRTELNSTIEAFDNSIENACIQFNTKQFEFFKEELKVKDTDSFFVEIILGSIFTGLAGKAIVGIADKIFTPIIKTRALVIKKGNNIIVSKITEAEIDTFKKLSLPSNINFLSDDSEDSFAKSLFTGILDPASSKLIDRVLKKDKEESSSFKSKEDDFLTDFKEKIDFWTGQFKREQNKYIDKIISILSSNPLSSKNESELSKHLSQLRVDISQVDTLEEMRQIRYYYELCLWSLLYRFILFHGYDELRGQTYNDVTLNFAKGSGFQYPNYFNDIQKFNLPKKLPKNVYEYWINHFPHPLQPNDTFNSYYDKYKSDLANWYNVSINKGGYRRTTDPKYLTPLLEAEKYYHLSDYMQKIAMQFDKSSKFTDIVSGGPKK